jgi:hypothetical protein
LQSLTDVTTTAFNLMGVLSSTALIYKVNFGNPTEINDYPNYLYVYLLHLVSPLFFQVTFFYSDQ